MRHIYMVSGICLLSRWQSDFLDALAVRGFCAGYAGFVEIGVASLGARDEDKLMQVVAETFQKTSNFKNSKCHHIRRDCSCRLKRALPTVFLHLRRDLFETGRGE